MFLLLIITFGQSTIIIILIHNNMDTKNLGFDTKLVHAGDFEDAHGSAVTPIYQTSTFAFKNANHGADLFAGKEKGFIYTRIGNPTIDALENKLAQLENGYRGVA